jgi:curved DNA-binding protein CbpA
LYSILGVTPDASSAQIENAYAELLLQLADGPSSPSDEQQRIRLIAVKEAYAVLSDPTKRQLYNQKLFAPEAPARPATASGPLQEIGATTWIKAAQVLGGLLIAALAVYSYHSKEQEKLRLQLELQRKAAELVENEQQQRAEENEARQLRQQQVDAQARERQERYERERLNREIDSRQYQNARAEEQKAQRERYERLQAEREADNRSRREAADARMQAQREKAELQRMEREHYGKVITY